MAANNSKLNIDTRQVAIGYLLGRIEAGGLDIASNYRLHYVPWNTERKAQFIKLIESRSPLPPLYINGMDTSCWTMISEADGLIALKQTFDEMLSQLSLHPSWIREYEETEITVHLVEAGTSPEALSMLQEAINPKKERKYWDSISVSGSLSYAESQKETLEAHRNVCEIIKEGESKDRYFVRIYDVRG